MMGLEVLKRMRATRRRKSSECWRTLWRKLLEPSRTEACWRTLETIAGAIQDGSMLETEIKQTAGASSGEAGKEWDVPKEMESATYIPRLRAE